ncbi:hypothetical protein FALCPG4_013020 [Fusarium falciforme]
MVRKGGCEEEQKESPDISLAQVPAIFPVEFGMGHGSCQSSAEGGDGDATRSANGEGGGPRRRNRGGGGSSRGGGSGSCDSCCAVFAQLVLHLLILDFAVAKVVIADFILTEVVTAPNPLVRALVLMTDLVEKAAIREAIGTGNISKILGLLLAV